MTGEKNLDKLLRNLEPKLNPGTYVFVSWPTDQPMPEVEILATFRETEGITLVVTQEIADFRAWNYDYQAAWITLQVHSALEAVGLTAAVAQVLADVNISCNVWAAYYHDHIFVAQQQADAAMAALAKLNNGRL